MHLPGKRGHYKRSLTVEAINVHPKYVVGGSSHKAVFRVERLVVLPVCQVVYDGRCSANHGYGEWKVE